MQQHFRHNSQFGDPSCSRWTTVLRCSDDANAAVRGSVQINGVDVRTREQAIQMFAENREDISLLLARPASQVFFSRMYIVTRTSAVAVIADRTAV